MSESDAMQRFLDSTWSGHDAEFLAEWRDNPDEPVTRGDVERYLVASMRYMRARYRRPETT